MGNCISKINKDRFFAVEEFMKNDIFFSNGTMRYHLDMLYRGTYTGVHSKASRKNNVGPIGNWSMLEKPLKRVGNSRQR